MCSLCSVLFLMISLQSDFVDANIRVPKIFTLIRWILYRYEICGKETLKCENIQQGEITSLNIMHYECMYRFSFAIKILELWRAAPVVYYCRLQDLQQQHPNLINIWYILLLTRAEWSCGTAGRFLQGSHKCRRNICKLNLENINSLIPLFTFNLLHYIRLQLHCRIYSF